MGCQGWHVVRKGWTAVTTGGLVVVGRWVRGGGGGVSDRIACLE